MEAAQVVGVKKLRVLGDSQLIVRQVETLLPFAKVVFSPCCTQHVILL